MIFVVERQMLVGSSSPNSWADTRLKLTFVKVDDSFVAEKRMTGVKMNDWVGC